MRQRIQHIFLWVLFFRQYCTASNICGSNQSFHCCSKPPPFRLFLEAVTPAVAIEIEVNVSISNRGRLAGNQRVFHFPVAYWLMKQWLKIRMGKQCLHYLTTTTSQCANRLLPLFIKLEMMATNSTDYAIQQHLGVIE